MNEIKFCRRGFPMAIELLIFGFSKPVLVTTNIEVSRMSFAVHVGCRTRSRSDAVHRNRIGL